MPAFQDWMDDADTTRAVLDAADAAARVEAAVFSAAKAELERWLLAAGRPVISDAGITEVASDAAFAVRNAFWRVVAR